MACRFLRQNNKASTQAMKHFNKAGQLITELDFCSVALRKNR